MLYPCITVYIDKLEYSLKDIFIVQNGIVIISKEQNYMYTITNRSYDMKKACLNHYYANFVILVLNHLLHYKITLWKQDYSLPFLKH